MRFLNGLNPTAKLVVMGLTVIAALGIIIVGVNTAIKPSSKISLFSNPSSTTRKFVRLMASGDSDEAIDLVCPTVGGGITVLPTLKFDWRKDTYQLVNKTDQTADIRMIGESQITKKDWENWSEGLQLQIPQMATARAELDFTWNIEKDNFGHWCVPKASLMDFIYYLIELMQKPIENMNS
jgi:hypothetical protein